MPETRTLSGNALVDLLDRVVERGAVITGDVIISLAGIDLLRLDLRVLLAGIDTGLDTLPAATADHSTEDGRAP